MRRDPAYAFSLTLSVIVTNIKFNWIMHGDETNRIIFLSLCFGEQKNLFFLPFVLECFRFKRNPSFENSKSDMLKNIMSFIIILI